MRLLMRSATNATVFGLPNASSESSVQRIGWYPAAATIFWVRISQSPKGNRKRGFAPRPHAITIATNMAGRGTDIELGTGVVACGGLQVLLTEFHESARVDRQLFGRAARQGDPGGGEAIVALDDELFLVHAPKLAAWVGKLWPRAEMPPGALWLLRSAAQMVAEARHRRMRAASLEHDRRLAAMLAFSGRGE